LSRGKVTSASLCVSRLKANQSIETVFVDMKFKVRGLTIGAGHDHPRAVNKAQLLGYNTDRALQPHPADHNGHNSDRGHTCEGRNHHTAPIMFPISVHA
jgi:hypothetical protein